MIPIWCPCVNPWVSYVLPLLRSTLQFHVFHLWRKMRTQSQVINCTIFNKLRRCTVVLAHIVHPDHTGYFHNLRSKSLLFFQFFPVLCKMVDLAKRRIDEIRKKYKFSDIVDEHHQADPKKWALCDFVSLNTSVLLCWTTNVVLDGSRKSSWDIFRGLRPLNPKRTTTRKWVPSSMLADTHLKVRVTVNSARGLPVRQREPLKYGFHLTCMNTSLVSSW